MLEMLRKDLKRMNGPNYIQVSVYSVSSLPGQRFTKLGGCVKNVAVMYGVNFCKVGTFTSQEFCNDGVD